jgi:hypothetical protein
MPRRESGRPGPPSVLEPAPAPVPGGAAVAAAPPPPVVYTATALDSAGRHFRLEVQVAAGAPPQRLPYYHGDSQFWTVVDAAGESLPYRGPKAKRRAPENVPDGKGWITVNAGETKVLQGQVDLKYFEATGRPRPFTYSVHRQAVQVIPQLLREEDASAAKDRLMQLSKEELVERLLAAEAEQAVEPEGKKEPATTVAPAAADQGDSVDISRGADDVALQPQPEPQPPPC